MSDVPVVTLTNGVRMPQLGFGTFRVPPAQAESTVRAALEAGYRSIDTAAAYQNEEGVGRALAASGLPREEVFVTTKVWNSDHGYDETLRAFDHSLRRLGLSTMDLYMIHWPLPSADRYMETWKALVTLLGEGRTRAIGVCNFKTEYLRRLLDESDTVPAVNQIELHPYLQQADVRQLHAEHGIVTEAWAPLGQGGDLLTEPVIAELGARHGVTPAQVVLRWHLQSGYVAIPKSSNPQRMRENLDVFGFELTAEEMATIDSLEAGRRLGPDPATFAVI